MIREHLTRSARATRLLGVVGGLCLAISVAGTPAHAAEAPVGLGTAGSFAVLAGQSITNTGPSVVSGDIGVGPGTAVSGIPPLVQTGGALHVADAVAIQAQADLTTAYNSAAGRSTVTDVTGQNLGNRTFTTGVVEHTSGMQLTGDVILDAQGDPSAVFIFKAGSTLVTASGSRVSLINGASPCNVYWQVGSSATLGTNTTFVGTVMALTSATLTTGASLQGRVLARNGSVTLDTNVINRPICAASASPSPTPTPSPTSTTPTATASPSTTTPAAPSATPSPAGAVKGGSGSGGGGNSGNGGSGSGGSDNSDSDSGGSGAGSGAEAAAAGGGGGLTSTASGSTPVVPVGHPETGLGGGSQPTGPAWGLLALLSGLTAAALVLSWRRARLSRPVGLRQ